jgi:AAA15 family ATPase/GTPase
MLLRASISNLFSFNELTEFNMLSDANRRHDHHVANIRGIDVLKFGLIYGANAAGKSNLIKSIELVNEAFDKGYLDVNPDHFHKFNAHLEHQTAFVELEFFSSETVYLYGIEFSSNEIVNEYLYQSGLGKKEDKLIFEKTVDTDGNSILAFGKSFEDNRQMTEIKRIIQKKVIKKNELLVRRLIDFEVDKLNKPLLDVADWFARLTIIYPKSTPFGLLYNLNDSEKFLDFSNDILSKIDVGISKLSIEEFTLKEYFGENDRSTIKEIQEQIANQPKDGFIPYQLDVLILNQNNEVKVKVLKIVHVGGDNQEVKFSFHEESDGTKRMIEYLIMLYDLTLDNRDSVYLIDEIERSIHPHLLKKMLAKVTSSKQIFGQLIFTTHESHLMDQNLFRTDEIWLTEKNERGETSFAPLSEYKLRTDLDLRKGYLSGRFGAIPVMANFDDLNWMNHAT